MEAQQQQQQKHQQQQRRQQQQPADVKSVAVWTKPWHPAESPPLRVSPALATDSDSGADGGPCDTESSSDEEPSLVSLVRLALIAQQGAKGKGKGTSIGKGKRQDKDDGNGEEKGGTK